MLAEFIIMFREAIEASLIVGIMIAYLHKTKNEAYEKHVYLGVATALIASVIVAYGFSFVQGGFEAHEEVFEGVFMIFATAFLTWFILWMVAHKNIAHEIRNNVKGALDTHKGSALFLLSFTAVFREGIEAVLFMAGISITTGSVSFVGGLLGLVGAIIVGYMIFEQAKKFDLAIFFKVTTVFLIIIAAGLFSYGVHELSEAGFVPKLIDHVWNINPPLNADGSYPLLHEKGIVGSMAKALFGYDGDPSLIRIIAYLGYLAGVYVYIKLFLKSQ